MQTLHILATTPESGQALFEALAFFDAELIEATDGRYAVTVKLGGDEAQTAAVLNVLQQHLTEGAQTEPPPLMARDYLSEFLPTP